MLGSFDFRRLAGIFIFTDFSLYIVILTFSGINLSELDRIKE